MLDIFSPPCDIYFDFFAISSSNTRTHQCLIHPSVATHINNKTRYLNLKDAEEILSEFGDQDLAERVLERHHLVRTLDSEQSLISSNVKIDKLVCLWAYINPLETSI